MTAPLSRAGSDRTLEPLELRDLLAARPDDEDRERPEVLFARHDGRPVVVKRGSGRSRGALRREAEVLGRLDVPGVVQLVELIDDGGVTAIVLADAGHRTMRQPDGLVPSVLLRAMRHTAHVLADLHARGWSHGDLRPDHVVINARGRVRLCSFGSARPIDVAATAGHDVEALLGIIDGVADRLEGDGHRRPAKRLRAVTGRMRECDDLDAGTVADALDDLCRGASGSSRARGVRRLPGRPRVPGRRTAVVALAALGVALLVAAAPSAPAEPPAGLLPVGAATGVAPDPTPPSTTLPAPTGPTIRYGDTTYRVGLAGDVALVADFDCDGVETVRVHRPSTGELFEFDHVPSAGRRIEGRRIDPPSEDPACNGGPRP